MTNTQFDIDYLRRYVQGELSASEMHIIEIASQEDEMLMDIISGLEYELLHQLSNPNDDITTLITNRSKQTTIIPKKRFPFKTWSIAASLLIALGVSAIYYYSNQTINSNTELIAVNKENKIEKQNIYTPKELTDSSITDKQDQRIAYVESTPEIKTETADDKPEHISLDPITSSKNIEINRTLNNSGLVDITTEEVIVAHNPNKQKETIAANNQSFLLAETKNLAPKNTNSNTSNQSRARLSGMNLDPQSQNILRDVLDRQAREELKNQTIATVGKNKVTIMDSAMSNALANNYIGSKNIKQEQIAEDEGYLAEVIITARGKKAVKSNKISEPQSGMEKYMTKLIAEINKSIIGSFYFKIQFKLNKEGEPSNIKFLESTHPSLEPELIKYLMNGEKWKLGNDSNKIILEINK